MCILVPLKKLLEPIQSYEDVPISGSKWTICPKQKFFGTNHYCYFHLPIGPSHCAKLGPKMVHLPPKKFYLKNY